MIDEKMQDIANVFKENGLGIVVMIRDEDGLHRCFSTVSNEELYSILEDVSFAVAMMPVSDDMDGFVRSAGFHLDFMASRAADFIDCRKPTVVVAVGEGEVSALVEGSCKELVYMCVRTMVTMRSRCAVPEMFRFYQSDN